MNAADLVLHPIRLRILVKLAASEATATQLRKHLPDVSRASLYRHIRALQDAELLEVVSTQQRRGSVEKTYRARELAGGPIPAEEVAAWTPQQMQTHYATFSATLTSAFASGLDATGSVAGIHFRLCEVRLSPEDILAVEQDFLNILMRKSTDDGQPFLLSYQMFPTGEQAAGPNKHAQKEPSDG